MKRPLVAAEPVEEVLQAIGRRRSGPTVGVPQRKPNVKTPLAGVRALVVTPRRAVGGIDCQRKVQQVGGIRRQHFAEGVRQGLTVDPASAAKACVPGIDGEVVGVGLSTHGCSTSDEPRSALAGSRSWWRSALVDSTGTVRLGARRPSALGLSSSWPAIFSSAG